MTITKFAGSIICVMTWIIWVNISLFEVETLDFGTSFPPPLAGPVTVVLVFPEADPFWEETVPEGIEANT